MVKNGPFMENLEGAWEIVSVGSVPGNLGVILDS
jgi:hypothetical protein